ncbi:hypothetical protein [Mycobacterium sp.]|nr:hypothetical protein [Mycobacterium sp.]HTY35373.1 hypothetical protein [Mycobacterium sp.]
MSLFINWHIATPIITATFYTEGARCAYNLVVTALDWRDTRRWRKAHP